MADGPTPAKKKKTDTAALPECPYGARCYRKNPQHFKDFSHSSGGSDSKVSDSKDDIPAPSTAPATDDSHLPPCKYGANCYRKNLLHFAEYSHPTSHPSKAKSESGSDTDVIDSDDDKEKKKAGKKGALLKGMSLVKKFSQMTDDERKELIKKALEEKFKLQQELEGTKKLVEEKDQKLQEMQNKLSSGLLMMEGEVDALKKTTTTYFTLLPERAYKEGSANQIHFRLAESQFYRLVTGDHSSQVRVTKVEYVVSPPVVKRFRAYQEELKKRRGESYSYPVLAFHGTAEKNIQPICETGFKTPSDKGFKQKTDAGWYGAGVYFSEYPSYSMGYIQGASKLMLCQVLPGKVYKCSKITMGASLQPGYDSHTSPCKKELVIFDSAAILPSYLVYFTNASGTFTYTGAGVTVTGSEMDDYCKAVAKPASKVFKGKTITVSGKMVTTQANLYSLITQHGGTKGTAAKFDILVASPDMADGMSKKAAGAANKSRPVVSESYLYQCILQKKLLDTSDYELSVG